MKASDVLGAMVDNMTPDTWYKGSFTDPDNPESHCLLGHIGALTKWAPDAQLVRQDTIIYLRHQINGVSIPSFNDSPDTTFEDVALVVKKAYVEALEGEDA